MFFVWRNPLWWRNVLDDLGPDLRPSIMFMCSRFRAAEENMTEIESESAPGVVRYAAYARETVA